MTELHLLKTLFLLEHLPELLTYSNSLHVLGLVCHVFEILRRPRASRRTGRHFQSRYPINFVVKHPNPLSRGGGPALGLLKPVRQSGPVSRSLPPQWWRSGNSEQQFGGADRDRTGDPLLAKQVLSQLSYSPT